MKPQTRTVIDTIEYYNMSNARVVITLVQYRANAYTVEIKIGNTISTRGFASESQANNFIVSIQRG